MSCSCLGSKCEIVKIVENGNWFGHYCSWRQRKGMVRIFVCTCLIQIDVINN